MKEGLLMLEIGRKYQFCIYYSVKENCNGLIRCESRSSGCQGFEKEGNKAFHSTLSVKENSQLAALLDTLNSERL